MIQVVVGDSGGCISAPGRSTSGEGLASLAGNWAARGFLGTSRVESLGDGDLFAVFGNVSKIGGWAPDGGSEWQAQRLAAAPWREFGEAPRPPHTLCAIHRRSL